MNLVLFGIIFILYCLHATNGIPDILYGVATAAYQIEGARYVDGNGLNIW